MEQAAYLLTWNPTNWEWFGFTELWENVQAGETIQRKWSCGNTKKIRTGDRVFLMRLGYQQPIKGIFASGTVINEPEEGVHWRDPESTTLSIEFIFNALLDPDEQPLLDPHTVSTDFNWFPQSSGVTIPPEIAQKLEEQWQQHLSQLGMLTTDHSDADNGQIFYEGKRRTAVSTRYERNQDARAACLAHYGYCCCICGFDFKLIYGDTGYEYIHVHHLNPVAAQANEYQIDPVRDLRPVCPNCHVMLHRRTPPFSIEELVREMAGMDKRLREFFLEER